jgi:hypothetical protein
MACVCNLDSAQAARAQYLELQNRLRQELGLKRLEKNNDKIMEELLWGIPEGSRCFEGFRPLVMLRLFLLCSPRSSARGFLAG